MVQFPSMSAAELQRLLERGLGYYVWAQRGSHGKLRSHWGYPQLTFAFHDRAQIPPGLVRKILVKDVGLSPEEGRRIIG